MEKQSHTSPKLKALVAIFDKNGSQILFQFNKNDNKFLRFPGGKIQKGESAEDCIKREITKEEYFLELTNIKPWIFCENFFEFDKQIKHEILIIHSAEIKNSVESFPKTHSEDSDILLNWFNFTDLGKYLIVPKGIFKILHKKRNTIHHFSNFNGL